MVSPQLNGHHHHHHRRGSGAGQTKSVSCNQYKKSTTTTVMRRTLNKIRDKKLSLLCRFNRCETTGLAGSKFNNTKSSAHNAGSWDDMGYSESQNSVTTLNLFKYAHKRELFAIAMGIVSMVYAASWQPISVFILAIMASLMGQYSKQINWLKQLNNTSPSALETTTTSSTTTTTSSTTHASAQMTGDASDLVVERMQLIDNNNNNNSYHDKSITTTNYVMNEYNGPLVGYEQQRQDLTMELLVGRPMSLMMSVGASQQQQDQQQQHRALSTYDDYSFLNSLYSFVTPLFDLGSGGNSGSSHKQHLDTNDIHEAVNEILEHESTQFLRKSFEINGSAFVLALTQLFAFFFGMILITWAAKKQASRIKVLYFDSCLHQEVTWFEAIDSASGSGSSLNGLVEKFEDGIGMKLALLCYFLGHVALFAATAFYQMFSLAAFCMPFVLLIGLIIAYLSDLQANSIGQHALFAKRSLQLAEEIIAAVRTVFAFNGQQKEITRYSLSLEPVYRKSLIKHLYTALNTSLSKFSIFACFAMYCFYAKHMFPPYSEHANTNNKATILAVMRGAEVSIVNILISIPFMEALQQSKGSIARIFVAIERRSKISASSGQGLKLSAGGATSNNANKLTAEDGSMETSGRPELSNNENGIDATTKPSADWTPSISFRTVHFGYADRSGPTRRRSTLPFLNLAGPTTPANSAAAAINSSLPSPCGGGGYANNTLASTGQQHLTASVTHNSEASSSDAVALANVMNSRRRSVIETLTNEALAATKATPNIASIDTSHANKPTLASATRRASNHHMSLGGGGGRHATKLSTARRQSAVIRNMLGNEIRERRLCANRQILSYLSLDIQPGQSVALVGPSGAGKSTILSLVQRLYDITGGQLLVGGHDIRDLNVAWLRNQIGVVGQEPRLFDMSIAENIMLGLPREQLDPLLFNVNLSGELAQESTYENGGSSSSSHATSSRATREAQLMQQVVAAARAANAHEFIVRLPGGYATRVGSAGVQLSGGQKQRIAIARALIRKPKILLLDECTSALDTESEAQVHAALKSASAGRTTLIVAHRLETIKHVDMIAVMNQGQVVACGTHEELMRQAHGGSGGGGGNDNAAPSTSSAASSDDDDALLGARLYKQLYEEQRQAMSEQQRECKKIPDDDDDELNLNGKKGEHTNAKSTPGGRVSRDKRRKDDCCDGSEHTAASHQLKGANDDDTCRNKGKNLAELAGFVARNDTMPSMGADDQDDDDDDDDDDIETASTFSSSTGSSDEHRPGAWKLWQFIEMPKWSSLVAVVVCLLAGLILPLNLIAHSYLFSVFAYNELDQIGEYLHVFGLLILSFSTFVFIVSFLQVILPGYVGEKMSIGLRVKTLDALLQKPMFYFDMDSNSAGAICDRFNSYISNLQNIAGTRVATMLEAISTLAAGAVFGFGQNFILSTFCLSFALLVLITTIIESRIVERQCSLQQKYDTQLAHLMSDALSNIKTIASLNKEYYFIHKFRSILKQRERGIGAPLVCLHTFLTSLKFVMPALSWSASMFYGSYLLTSGRIDLQTIYIVCPVVLFAVNDTFRALVFLPELLKARKSVQRLYKLNKEFSPEVLQTLTFAQQLEEQNRLHLNQLLAEAAANATSGAPLETSLPPARRESNLLSLAPPGEAGGAIGDGNTALNTKKKSISFALEAPIIEQEPDGVHLSAPNQHNVNRRLSNIQNLPTYMRRKSSRLNSLVPRQQARGRIEFRGVEFAYPNRPTALVLDGFSLSVAPGESVALVGTSGSGKSTTVSILEKFYDYHSGMVMLDGRDLRLVEPNWVRSQIGLVQQEPCLLSYTIGDNIRYGDNSRFVSMEEVVEAARTANIHDFIMTLPDQYDTELSSSAYSSCQLSGGQRQRIAIARALVRNAPILIFDEATSALDNKSEQVVQDALNKAKRGRTNLTIAHRLATVKDADKIVVMRDGRVVEMGKHNELVARQNGFYRSLWKRQGGGGGADDNSDQSKSGFV